jgi:hypothetical protein
MTRKHFKAIAQAIKNNSKIVVFDNKTNANIIDKDNLISELCVIFARDNSLFNKQLFIDACNDDNV